MFQPWFVELISVLSNCLVGASAVVVSAAAVFGLTQWRSELKGKARLDMARRLSVLAYRFRDQYHAARGMVTFGGESTDREVLQDETADETRYRNEYFARFNRLLPVQETMRELYQASWEGEVVFDSDVEALVRPLGDALNELWIAIDTYFSHHIERSRVGALTEPSDASWLRDYHGTIYGHAGDDLGESVSENVKSLVEKIRAAV